MNNCFRTNVMIIGCDLTLCNGRVREVGKSPKINFPAANKGEDLRSEGAMCSQNFHSATSDLSQIDWGWDSHTGQPRLSKPSHPALPSLPNS